MKEELEGSMSCNTSLHTGENGSVKTHILGYFMPCISPDIIRHTTP